MQNMPPPNDTPPAIVESYHDNVQQPVQDIADEVSSQGRDEANSSVARQQEEAARAQQGTHQHY